MAAHVGSRRIGERGSVSPPSAVQSCPPATDTDLRDGVECAVGQSKSFAGDLSLLIDAVRAHQPFAFSRFGDGEWTIIRDLPIDITQKENGEFRFDPADARDQASRQALIDSFHYVAPGYLVGIGCPCCWGLELLRPLRALCRQPESRLTWANLWGNANYPRVCRELIPAFNSYHDVFIVCHRRADPSRLPFRVSDAFPVGTNAWTEDFGLLERITRLARSHRGALFLFCAGPFANILAQRGHAANPANTYLDFGSVLDPWLFARRRFHWLDWFPRLIRSPGVTRGYLKPGRKRQQVCRWWDPSDAANSDPTQAPDVTRL